MKKSVKKKYLIPLLIVAFVSTAIFLLPKDRTEAAGLTSAYMYMSRIKADLTSGVVMTLVLTPSGSTSGSDSIDITFPDAEDGEWCTTAGSLTTNTTVSFESATALPGTLSASCAQGSGAGSYDTITISGINALSAATDYVVMVSPNAGDLGTSSAGDHIVTVDLIDGANLQSFSFGVETIADDQVVVSATVSDAPTINCSLSTTTLNLGTLFRGGSYASASHTFTASTSSNANGYYVAAWGTGDGSTEAGLYKSTATTYLIESVYGDNTVDLGTNEGYGLRVSDPDGGGTAAVGTDFANGSVSVYGTIGNLETEAKVLYYQTSAETSGDTSTITHGAAASASAEVGSYTETVTFMCGGFY